MSWKASWRRLRQPVERRIDVAQSRLGEQLPRNQRLIEQGDDAGEGGRCRRGAAHPDQAAARDRPGTDRGRPRRTVKCPACREHDRPARQVPPARRAWRSTRSGRRRRPASIPTERGLVPGNFGNIRECGGIARRVIGRPVAAGAFVEHSAAHAVTSGKPAGKVARAPLDACGTGEAWSQVAAPRSPDDTRNVMPCALACCATAR